MFNSKWSGNQPRVKLGMWENLSRLILTLSSVYLAFGHTLTSLYPLFSSCLTGPSKVRSTLELDLADFTRSVAVGFFPGERLIMRHFATCEPRGRPGHVGDIDEGAAAADHYGNRNAVPIVVECGTRGAQPLCTKGGGQAPPPEDSCATKAKVITQ